MLERAAYDRIKVSEVTGRYLPPAALEDFLTKWLPNSDFDILGYSVEKRPVFGVRLGSGPVRVLMWSQMHGNESTTTRAVLDLINSFYQSGLLQQEAFEFFLIPMLNPDGAHAYRRHNANDVDLNRDAQLLSQPESVILREAYREFAPHYCFNLHDQRTIFSAGDHPKPATLSFLAPSANSQKAFPDNRVAAARLIAELSRPLRNQIGVGRYDDTFNPDCVGDFFQSEGTPTLLFEAGHYPGDYQREQTRYFVYCALQNALNAIRSGSYMEVPIAEYAEIPENKSRFLDILIHNVHYLDKAYPPGTGVGLQYTEFLKSGRIHFQPGIVQRGQLEGYFGHAHWDASQPGDLRRLKDSVELMSLFLSDSR
jgi:hypothetical protein